MYKRSTYFLLLSISILFFVVGNITEAKWYNSYTTTFSATGNKLCNTDGDVGDDKCVTKTTVDITGTSTCPSSVDISPTTSGSMRCWYWDGTAPTISTTPAGGAGTWTNSSGVKMVLSDTGGSGLNSHKYKWNDNTACTSGTPFTNGAVISLTEGINTLYVCGDDNAGNQVLEGFIYQVDRTPPDLDDLTVTLEGKAKEGNILATDSGVLSFDYTDTGSPIEIKYKLEDKTSKSLGSLVTISHTTPPITNVSWDVSLIDNDILSNGSRKYTTNIQLCDEAGNCSSDNDYNWYIYANTPVGNETLNFSNLDNEMIGDNTDICGAGISLKDAYGNDMIPATGINRTVTINLGYDNTVYLNQYDENNGGGIYYRMNGESVYTSLSIGSGQNISKIYSGTKTNGEYTFALKSYVPTYDGDNRANGRTRIKKQTYYITDTDGLLTVLNDITIDKYLKILPMVSAEITGLPPLASEGVAKDFDVILSETGSISYDKLNFMIDYNPNGEPIDTYIKKQAYTDPDGILDQCLYSTDGVGITNKWTSCDDWNQFNMQIGTNYGFSEGFAIQTGNLLNPEEIGFISTHIRVEHADGTYAVWNSDIVGRNNYNYEEVDEFYSTQTTVNIIGMVGSTSYDKLNQVLEGEAPTIGGTVNKSELRRDINKAVANLVRGHEGVATNSEEVKDIFNFGLGEYFMDRDVKVFYYHGDSNPKIILPENIGFTDKYLLIVEGGDVFLSGNLQQDGGLLGIVSLRRDDKGGHIYVNKDVTNIDALIYADGAIISYTGDPISGTIITQEAMSQSDLKNQIYVRGLLWSFNTLGASRSDVPYCPYFYPDGEVCDLLSAQKYDLEYFRRFYLVKPTVYDATADDKSWLPYYSPQALLAGGVECNLQNDGTDGDITDMDVVCTNTNDDLVNKLGITIGNPIVNPFGGDGKDITAKQKSLTAPIILEYDGRFKFDYMPVFTTTVY